MPKRALLFDLFSSNAAHNEHRIAGDSVLGWSDDDRGQKGQCVKLHFSPITSDRSIFACCCARSFVCRQRQSGTGRILRNYASRRTISKLLAGWRFGFERWFGGSIDRPEGRGEKDEKHPAASRANRLINSPGLHKVPPSPLSNAHFVLLPDFFVFFIFKTHTASPPGPLSEPVVNLL